MVVEKISFESQKKGHFATAAQEIPEPLSLLQKQLFSSLCRYWSVELLHLLTKYFAAWFTETGCCLYGPWLGSKQTLSDVRRGHFQCSYPQRSRGMQSFHHGSFNQVATMLLWWRLPFSPPAGGSIANRKFWHKLLLFRDLCIFSLHVQPSSAQALFYSHFVC